MRPIQILIVLLALGIIIGSSFYSSRRKNFPGIMSLICLELSIFVWSLVSILIGKNERYDWPLWPIVLLATTLAPVSLLTFVIVFTRNKNLLSWKKLIIFGIEPLVVQILYWVGSPRLPLISMPLGDRINVLNMILWDIIHPVYVSALVIFAIVLLVRGMNQSPRASRVAYEILLLGLCAPALAGFGFLANLYNLASFDLMLIAFSGSGICFFAASLMVNGEETIAISRDRVVENMKMGWMVLAPDNRIVDLNPAVEVLTGFNRSEMIGKSAEEFLSDWSNPIEQAEVTMDDLEMQGSVKVKGGWRYIGTYFSPLKDAEDNYLGQLIIWRDNTRRKAVEDARQRARDEMFILLNSISGAASRAQDVNEFLNTSMYQIIYSFNCQVGAIYIIDEGFDKSSYRLLLSAHHGLSENTIKKIYSLPDDFELFADIIHGKERMVLIPNIDKDPRVPGFLKQSEPEGHLLVVPLLTDEKIVGLLFLIRKEGLLFKSDEITRLSVLAQQVATFVHSERQRQIAISLSERQRVVRDLHDSVTQKLYGLVTHIEAAQAGLEVGTVVTNQTLARISENARQALREMRLFLHQLHPIDLEREGFVGALHQRLAAVEGRSDIKARLLTDENLTMPLNVEVTLYYIAQEALNNVLKHAHAKSVDIQLKKRKTHYVLEIKDDGQGFNTKKENLGCMGLNNMKERAMMAGGKLKIESHLGQGTKITASIPKDRQKEASL